MLFDIESGQVQCVVWIQVGNAPMDRERPAPVVVQQGPIHRDLECLVQASRQFPLLDQTVELSENQRIGQGQGRMRDRTAKQGKELGIDHGRYDTIRAVERAVRRGSGLRLLPVMAGAWASLHRTIAW